MNESYRIVMGERLKAFREDRCVSVAQVAEMGGISEDAVRMIESGSENYSIDAFLGYIRGCGLYMYFAEKEPKVEPHDFEDMARKAAENDPKK